MAEHVVVRPFPLALDGMGISSVLMAPGDVRDFGELAAGLLAEGFIKEPDLFSSAKRPEEARGPRVDVPDGWRDLHHSKRRALARQISGEEPEDTVKADAVIADYLSRRAG